MLLAVEAAGVAATAAYLGYEDVTAEATSLRDALLLTFFVALVAAALAGLAVALHRRNAWARSPAIVLQLLMLPTAYFMISGGMAWLGVPVGVLAVVVIGLLVGTATRDALGIH
jgi:hypothetical protein